MTITPIEWLKIIFVLGTVGIGYLACYAAAAVVLIYIVIGGAAVIVPHLPSGLTDDEPYFSCETASGAVTTCKRLENN